MDISDFEAFAQTPRVYVVRWPHRSQPSLIFSRNIAELEVLIDAVGGREGAEFIAVDFPFGIRLSALIGPADGYRATAPEAWEDAIGGLTSHDLIDEARWIRLADVAFERTAAAPMKVGA